MAMSIGEKVEGFYCHGIPDGRTFTQEERSEIIEFAVRFEECSDTAEELAALCDKDLVGKAYWAMAEYASGQI